MNECTKRPPIITVAGHIDHGKTTFLNFVSKDKNPQKEFGGITQHIKAYYVDTKYGAMTFLDTPGHFAFNSNRENCIRISDIVLIIIAADDGIKTQTLETINIAKKFNTSVMIGINKIDKLENVVEANDKILHALSKCDLVPEKWGGDVLVSCISAKTGEGVADLIDMLKLQADILDLKTNVLFGSYGIILENKIEPGRGFVTTLILKNGMLKKGDFVKIGNDITKIKSINDLEKKVINVALPSLPVEITGCTINLNIADRFEVVNNLKKNNKINFSDGFICDKKFEYSAENLMLNMKKPNIKKINVIIKVDVQGSVKVLKDFLEKLSTDIIRVNVVKIGIGTFTETDLDFAVISKSILLGFNIKIDSKIKKIALKCLIDIHVFSVIYEVFDFLQEKIKNEMLVDDKILVLGLLEIKKVFKYKDSVIAGCYVVSGKIKQNSNIKIKRNDVIVYEGSIESLRVYKTSVKEVKSGTECGINIKKYTKFQVNDFIEVY